MTTTSKTVVALIDADPIVYASAFACEKRFYLYNGAEYKGKVAATEALEADPGDHLWERLEVESVENALHNANRAVEKIIDAVGNWSKRDVGWKLYLTGSGNFRDELATIRPYKGNRLPWHKPRLGREVTAYLKEHWLARTAYGQEADDALSIMQTSLRASKVPSVIVSIDKDLLMVPGWHYNPTSGEFTKTSPQEGLVRFYRQVLTGDTTDNIGGCYKVGPARAREIVTPDMKETAMWNAVVTAYVASVTKYGKDTGYLEGPTPGPFLATKENARLVWMRREPDEIWEPPV